ncbi:RhoGAP-domain-containing protein [Coniophora puteana RWD-64-598 SS2]|uniref:RhoGAP-domain-containing protein n=1 Tax=Coniophora puteana (strain RWD-64-598) TaxID=741705 RepID=A0A5M3MJ02_CONPW|nr:RhoGAP-domain-containing protein [Coniophora puteana RWD-64-598 SS2]EIW79192.1 RhoGAP-domain-containing protein [Coniophora puteana RWD-64-598 SS2]
MSPESPLRASYLTPEPKPSGSFASSQSVFRPLRLVYGDLKHTHINVLYSSIKANDKGKEVISFVVEVDPGNNKEPWKVEKLYSDVLNLDQRVRSSSSRSVQKKMAHLPESKMWKDHAPAKVDQRRNALEGYLQSLINLPVKEKDDIIAFFTSDIVRNDKGPVSQVGYKEGYLTKRGKNFGGWKRRYFVLQGPVLEYYESRGGAHLGSITITGAQIGRQQRSQDNEDERNYRHAFLIIEARKGQGGHPRHVLCAESDAERDSWVDILVRYVSGTFNDDNSTYPTIGPSPLSTNVAGVQGALSAQSRSSTSSNQDSVASTPNGKRAVRSMSRDDISRGPASPAPRKSSDPSPLERTSSDYPSAEENARRMLERSQTGGSPEGLSSSLPERSPLEAANPNLVSFRANSELGHYHDTVDQRAVMKDPISPEQRKDRKSYYPSLAPSGERPMSPETTSIREAVSGKVKISGPLSGAPIPPGYKFGGKEKESNEAPPQNDRRQKGRSFWGFGKSVATEKPVVHVPRAVFGVPLEESLDVVEIARLPAVVFRCIQYLEAKQAEQEEGIYRLSGSSAVIKGLKDRFNMEGDVDLLASDEYWDPHAIAGLLKSFLRELPASILTRELHLKFLAVIDFVDAQERIMELSHLIASLPLANYTLLRALTAHLILIVQNCSINKMTMRNVGIVFSPTLGIPAGVFSLMLGEFNRVFNVDGISERGESQSPDEEESETFKRNSQQYNDAAADQLLGLSGRSLQSSTDESPSDNDSLSIQTESTADEETIESGAFTPVRPQVHVHQPHDAPSSSSSEMLSPISPGDTSTMRRSHASDVAASRGLNISTAANKRANRHSRMIGLPASPRPPPDAVDSPIPPSPATAKQG